MRVFLTIYYAQLTKTSAFISILIKEWNLLPGEIVSEFATDIVLKVSQRLPVTWLITHPFLVCRIHVCSLDGP